jgi:hypothetical protein
MAKPAALHGKFGVTKIGGAIARVVGWDINIDNSVMKYGVQGNDQDADAQVWLNKLSGWNDGKIEIEGYWLNEAIVANQLTGATYGLRPGTTGAGVGIFGFTSVAGNNFQCSFIVGNIRVGSKATDSQPATFRATLEVDGPITYPTA